MTNKNHIAIIYASKDDNPVTKGGRGWVTQLHRFLVTLMFQISREKIEIKLINEENFGSEELANYSVVLSIITENLARKSGIVKALNNRGDQLSKENKLLIGGFSPLFKILKQPYDSDEKFTGLSDLLTYDFYLIDPISGEPQEFTQFFGTEAEKSYWMKLVDIAYDIHHVLNTHDHDQAIRSGEQTPREKTVYLASTGVDMVIQRDIIKRELIRHGYTILPNHSLPKESKSLDRMIRKDLEQCRLSIHLIGEDYGYKPKGSELSIVDIQNRVASDHTFKMVDQNKTLREEDRQLFSRLIWVSPDLKNVTERQKIFIEDLKSDAAILEEAEVLQIQLQELKAIIREELMTGGRFQALKQGKRSLARDLDTQKMIYLIADKRDIKHIGEVSAYLKNQGYNVVSPTYEGDLVDLRYIHQENLRKCHAALIYVGTASEDWIKIKLQDLLKAPGFGRTRPLEASAIYFTDKKNVDMEIYQKNHTLVICNTGGGFTPEDLVPFLSQINAYE